MITANIKNADKYFCVNRNFENVFNFLKTLDKDTEPFDFEYEGFEGSVVELETEKSDGIVMEAHRDYLDIHYVICGEEGFGYADIDTLTPTTQYNKQDDYILFDGNNADKIVLKDGEFAVVFPEDAHAPAMYGRTTNKLKKVIVKIKID